MVFGKAAGHRGVWRSVAQRDDVVPTNPATPAMGTSVGTHCNWEGWVFTRTIRVD
jgi:hypothetical protein